MHNQGLQGYDNWVFEEVCELFKLLISILHIPFCWLQKFPADFKAAVGGELF